MTVSSEITSFSYDTDGVTTAFPVPFYFLANQHLRVWLFDTVTEIETDLVLGSGYNVTGAGNPSGGTVTTTATYPAGQQLRGERVVPVTQETAYQRNDPFPERAHERALDKLTMICQQLASIFGGLQGSSMRTLVLGRNDIDGQGAYRARQNRIADLADPVNGQDAANRQWVQQQIANLATDDSGQVVVEMLADSSSDSLGVGMSWYRQTGTRARSRRALDHIRETASLLDYKLANDIDDTAALQAMVNAHQLGHFVGPEQVFVIRDAIRLRNGTRLDLRGAKIVQLQAQTPIFDARNTEGVRIYSGELEGAKSFVNSPTSQDVGVFADNAADMMLSGLRARNFGYAAFRCQVGGEEIDIRDCTVIGFADELGPTDRNNMGFCLGGTSISLQGCRVRNTAQGLIVVEKSNSVSLIGNIIKDIPIEHGMYLDTSLRNIDVVGNVLRNIGHMGIKVQWYDAGDFGSPENILISGNSIYGCGDTAIAALNSQPTSPSPLYARNVSIVGNSISEITGSGIIARYVQAMKISGNNAYSVQQRGISTDSILSGSITDNELTNIQLYGIECYGQHRAMKVAHNKLREVGLTGQSNPSLAMGINVSEGRGFQIHDNWIDNDLFNLTYGINVEVPVSAGSSVYDNHIRGYISAGIRLPASLLPLDKFQGNTSVGQSSVNAVVNLPSAIVQGTGNTTTYSGTAAPTTGTWTKGDRVIAREPDPGQPAAWICVLSGTPGVWRVLQTVAA